MPIDARIPLLSERPRIMTPADAVSLQTLAAQQKRQSLAYQSELQDFEEQQQVRKLLSQPGAVEPDTGAPTPEAISSLYSVAPTYAQKAAADRQQVYLRLDQIRQANTQERLALGQLTDRDEARWRKAHEDETRVYVTTYDASIAAGAGEEEAERKAEQAFQDEVQTHQDSGLLSGIPADGIAKIRGQKRDIYSMRGKLQRFAPAEVLAEKKEIRAETRADQQAKVEAEKLSISQAELAIKKANLALEEWKTRNPAAAKLQTPENASKIASMGRANRDISDVRAMIFDKNGKLNRGILLGADVPFTSGVGEDARKVRSAMRNAADVILRMRTGAAAPLQEQLNLAAIFTPGVLDTEVSAAYKLDRLQETFDEALGLAMARIGESGGTAPPGSLRAPPVKTSPKATKKTVPPQGGWSIKRIE